jgi:hypothetical protein
MILKGSQRAGGAALAQHLLRTDENDHVTIHSMRGFISADLKGALKEAYAISRGTKCKQFLFSLSLNPPSDKSVPVRVFEEAIAKIERKLGLSGQPRAIVFHEKNGRRHAHCVWSRIRASDLRAVQLSYSHRWLQKLSREIYLENGWEMPRGLRNSDDASPLNFTQGEWQQAKRLERDPKRIKEIFRQCWAGSGNGRSFRLALAHHGYFVARGDRRAFVAVDRNGEIYSLTRCVGVSTEALATRFGNSEKFPDLEKVRTLLARKRNRIRIDGNPKVVLEEQPNLAAAKMRLNRSEQIS